MNTKKKCLTAILVAAMILPMLTALGGCLHIGNDTHEDRDHHADHHEQVNTEHVQVDVDHR